MNRLLVTSLFLFGIILWTTTALSCDSCGQECAAACGSRHFRACCFNYLRKRNNGGIDNIHYNDIEDTNKNDRTLLSQQYSMADLRGFRVELWFTTQPLRTITAAASPNQGQQMPYYTELSRTSRDIIHHQQMQQPMIKTSMSPKRIKIIDNDDINQENGNNSINGNNNRSNNEKSFYDER